jgi:hypothetical protein
VVASFYDAAARRIAPWSSVVFGAPLFFCAVRWLTRPEHSGSATGPVGAPSAGARTDSSVESGRRSIRFSFSGSAAAHAQKIALDGQLANLS